MNVSFSLFDLKRALINIADLDYKLGITEWKKAIYKTLGINLLDDYYSGEFYREALGKWVSENVELIKTVPVQSLAKIKEAVYIAEMTPKAIFADAVSVSNTCILIGELAKIIKQNGVDIGQNRLFAWMRENHKDSSGDRQRTAVFYQ